MCLYLFEDMTNMSKRRLFGEYFKAKVALEALQGDQRLNQIATGHKFYPNPVREQKLATYEDNHSKPSTSCKTIPLIRIH